MRQNSAVDYSALAFGTVFASVPTFVLGFVLAKQDGIGAVEDGGFRRERGAIKRFKGFATSDDGIKLDVLLWFLDLLDKTNGIEPNGLCDLQKLDEVQPSLPILILRNERLMAV